MGGPVTGGRLVSQREPGDEIGVGDEQPAEGDRLGDSRADAGGDPVVRGAGAVARQTLVLGPRARFAEPALVDGTVGVVVAPHGRLVLVLTVTVRDGRISGYDVIADPGRLRQLDLAVLGEGV